MKFILKYIIVFGYMACVHLAASVLFFENIAHACGCNKMHSSAMHHETGMGCGDHCDQSCGGEGCKCGSVSFSHHEQYTQTIQEIINTPADIAINISLSDRNKSYEQRYDYISKPPD